MPDTLNPDQPEATGDLGGASRERPFEDAMTEGVARFHVEMNIAASEMRNWHPDRIAAFFDALAQAISARKGIRWQRAIKPFGRPLQDAPTATPKVPPSPEGLTENG